MSWLSKRLTKEEHTHFDRDSSGKVVRVTHNGSEYKSTRQLESEYREKHPTRLQSFKQNVKRGMNERELEHMIIHAKEKEASRRGYERGRVQRAETRGFERGRGPRAIQQPKIKYVYKTRGGKKHRGKHRQIKYVQREPNVDYQFDMMTGRNVPVQRSSSGRQLDLVFDPWTGRYIRRR
jgi:hypothetical protein